MATDSASLSRAGAGRAAMLAGRFRLGSARAWLTIVVLGFIIGMPVGRMLWQSLSAGAHPYQELFDLPGFGRALWNTLYLAVGSVVIAVVGGLILARAAVRCNGRFAGVLRIIPMVPLALPTVANVVGWSFLLSPEVGYLNQLLRKTPLFHHEVIGPINVYSVTWITIITGLSLVSFVYLFVYTALSKIGPEYAEAARACGAGPLRRFLRVELPLLRPALVYSTITSLLLAIGQVTAPLLLGTRDGINVLGTMLYHISDTVPINYGEALALSGPFLALGLFILFAQRYLLRDQARYLTAHSVTAYAEGRAIGSRLILLVYGIVAVALPVLALLSVSLSRFWTGEVLPRHATLQSFRTVLSTDPVAGQAIRNSLESSLLAAAIAIPVGLFLATLISTTFSSSRWLAAVVEYSTALTLILPGILLGYGFLYAYTGSPFNLYGKFGLLVVAYVTLMLPHSVRSQSAVLATLKPEYWHAARGCGAGRVRAFGQILLPLIRGGTASGFILVFVLLSHEFTVSIMLQSPNTQVIGTVIFDYFSRGLYPTVAALALISALITSFGMGIALVLGRGRGGLSTMGF